jgi:predicted deacylase
MALHHLLPMLAEADRLGRVKGEIIVVPTVNPIGSSQLIGNSHLGRFDLLRRENFNRNWLDLSDSVADRLGGKLGHEASENVTAIRRAAVAVLAAMKPTDELQALRVGVMKLSIDADIVLDLHCEADAVLHLFISRKDWPGPAEMLAADVGAQAVVYNDPYPSHLTFAGVNSALWPRLAERFPAANIPQACLTATIEFRSEHEVNHALGEIDARSLYRFLVRRSVITGRAGKPPRLKTGATPVAGMDIGYSPRAGMLVYHVPKGAKVRKGTPICEVIDPAEWRPTKARTQILARTDGVLIGRRLDGRLAWPGMVVFRIAGAKVLAHRKGMGAHDD